MYIREADRELWKAVKRLALLVAALLLTVALCGLAHSQTIVQFSASWCGPCQRMRPIIDGLEQRGYHVRRIDFDRETDEAKRHRVEKLPTSVVLDAAGNEVGRIVGETTPQKLAELYVAPLGSQQPWQDSRVVKIRNHMPDGKYGFLTGSIVTIGGEASYVLTCAHGLEGPGDPVLIIFNDGKTTRIGDVVGLDENADCALVKLRGAASSAYFELADAEPVPGDKLFLAGFPEAEQWRGRYAKLVDYEQQRRVEGGEYVKVMVADGAAISGESGGPVVGEKGRIVGVIHSTRDQYTYCCRLGNVRALLDQLLPGRPGAIIPHANIPPPALPPQPQQPQQPQPQPTPDNGARLDKIEADIVALQQNKQDRGEYLQPGDVPDLTPYAKAADVGETQGLVERLTDALPSIIDDRIKSKLPVGGAVGAASSVLGVPSWLALPVALVGGPAGVGLSLAAMLMYRRLAKRTRATTQSTTNCGHGGPQCGGFPVTTP